MSLHIGNLSTGTSTDDLQHVFRRFGRCTVRVKDKYGFVVYEYPACAEKALKTLRGTRICGQAITLSWSKRQPQNLQRLPTGGEPNEQPLRRSSVKEYTHRRLGSYARRESEMNSHIADAELRTVSYDLIYELISYQRGDLKCFATENSRASLTDRRGIGGRRRNHLYVSRWDEQAVDSSNENYMGNKLDFDRYEPHNTDGKKEYVEDTNRSPMVGSPSVKNNQDIRGHSYDEKPQRHCYFCGEMGHKRSNCPLEPKGQVSGYRGRLHPSGNTVPFSGQDIDRQASTSKIHQRLLRCGDSSTREVSPGDRRIQFKDKKRNRRDYESQDKSCLETDRGPSSSIHSDYIISKSHSPIRSSRSLSQPSSQVKLKSVPSEKISLPSSHGSSPLRHSGYKTFSSRSKSGSGTPVSSFLPDKDNQNVSPFANKAQEKSKGSLATAVNLHPSTDLFQEETQFGAIRSQCISSVVGNKCETRPANLEHEGMMKNSSVKDKILCHSFSRDSHELLQPHVPLSNDDERIVDNLYLHSMKGMRGSENEQILATIEPNNSVKSNASSSVGMSLEEVRMVLKHYGLQYPGGNEKDLPVEVYFGSARFWPWEMIYYRRLKKGHIS